MEKHVSLTLQTLWDKYTFESEISQGAFGIVYKVKNTKDGKFYAMKIQDLKKLINDVPDNYSNEFIRILREINTFKLCHSNITKVYESYFTIQDQFVIITELAENDLKSYRKANQDISNGEIIEIMIQLMKGTNYLHKQNIMHRDLSPDNILVFRNGTEFKLCDLGLSTPNVQSKVYVGKQYFKAPEIKISNDSEYGYNHQVDIWSAGVILYYLCTEQYNYGPKKLRLAEIKQQDPSCVFTLPPNRKIFEPLLNKMLRLNPHQRPQALEIISDLCYLIGDSLQQHIDEEEVKINDVNSNPFALTLQSHTSKVNEILTQLGNFNFTAVQNIHTNPNRIFVSQIKASDYQYQGEIDNDLKQPDGRGRKITLSGQVHEGLWKNNQLNGYGRQIFQNGSYYIGEFKDGNANGFGKYYFTNGNVYKGKWLLNKSEGLGLYKWIDGDQYFGQWVNNQKQGVGVFTCKYGNTYLGQFENNQYHGIFMYIQNDGEQIQIRRYENNEYEDTLFEIDNSSS
ncbi:protein kinase domain containing protein [Stylonychia lemnae]|uniref:Protein kinase domain containing protein n=1 Tax=Stylonychia lemnae TaxID=5949 RepID=A0A078AD23_STYLE|nr:protein kinase domain containing protein [Stylonychia lemnae]|eukprot:CDW78758.1 protein kinase domain containing protein [Stylonychia lemnae]